MLVYFCSATRILCRSVNRRSMRTKTSDVSQRCGGAMPTSLGSRSSQKKKSAFRLSLPVRIGFLDPLQSLQRQNVSPNRCKCVYKVIHDRESLIKRHPQNNKTYFTVGQQRLAGITCCTIASWHHAAQVKGVEMCWEFMEIYCLKVS